MGNSGSGNITKLISNYLAIMYICIYSEIFPLAEKLGVNIENVYNIIGESGVNCGLYQIAGRKIISKKYEQAFAIKLAYKDLSYVKQLFEKYTKNTLILDICMDRLKIAMEKGLRNCDISEVAKIQHEFLNMD